MRVAFGDAPSISKLPPTASHFRSRSSRRSTADGEGFKAQRIFGNPQGNRHRTRHLLSQELMQALLLYFRHRGKKAIEKVARNQPAAYLKILALLVPRR
jgi:hypothetical protein